MTSGRKNVPVCSVGPLPEHHSTQSSSLGPFVSIFHIPKPRAEATVRPRAPRRSPLHHRTITRISLFCHFNLSDILDLQMASVNGRCFFPLLPLTAQMLIASPSESSRSHLLCGQHSFTAPTIYLGVHVLPCLCVVTLHLCVNYSNCIYFSVKRLGGGGE